MSESEAAGRLIKIPGMVEAAATKPLHSVGVPRLAAKGFNTGLLDIVELKIANPPITQRVQKTIFTLFLVLGFKVQAC
jgi:hypothetical protein